MQQDPSSAVDAVRSFAEAWRQARTRFLADNPALDGVESLLRAVRSERTMPREGRSSSGIEYTVHGAGCRMTDENGQTLDIDIVLDLATGEHVEAFDAWRIRWFLDPDAGTPAVADKIEAACQDLARARALREVPAQHGRWFALTGQ